MVLDGMVPKKDQEIDITNLRAFPRPQTPEDAVANGVKLLDAAAPRWRERLNLARLDISRVEDCVLGQIFFQDAVQAGDHNGYQHAVGRFGFGSISRRSSGEFGFSGFSLLITLRSLQDAWLDELS